jgi:hypothetical protein
LVEKDRQMEDRSEEVGVEVEDTGEVVDAGEGAEILEERGLRIRRHRRRRDRS